MDKVQELVTIQAQKISELKETIRKLEVEKNQLLEVLQEYQVGNGVN